MAVPVSEAQLRATLRELQFAPGQLVKAASQPGQDEDTQFERAFGQLAYNKVKDRVPQLIPFLKGFQLVDRDNDNTKALGVFGFQLNRRWFYVPAFFINNSVKGTELLYIKDQDRFIPSSEANVNTVLSERPESLGAGTSQRPDRLFLDSPNYREITETPTYRGKYAGKLDNLKAPPGSHIQDDLLPFVARIAKHASKTEEPQWLHYLPAVLSLQPELAVTAMQVCNTYPGFKQAFFKQYGDVLVQALQKLASRAAAPTPKQPKTAAMDFDNFWAKPKEAAVIIFRNSTVSYAIAPEEQESMARDGFVIRDRRSEAEKSKLITDTEIRLQNPTCNGVYDVLTGDNKNERVLVVAKPLTFPNRQSAVMCLSLDGSPKALVAKPDRIFAVEADGEENERNEDSCREQIAAACDKFTAVTSPSTGDVYVLINCQTGDATSPFKVTATYSGDDTFLADFKGLGYDDIPVGDKPRLFQAEYMTDWNNRDETVRLEWGSDVVMRADPGCSRIHKVRNTIVYPPECKLVKVTKGDNWFVPGDLAAFKATLRSKTAELRLVQASPDEIYFPNQGRMPVKEALFHLVQGYGLSVDDARFVMKTAAANAVRRLSTNFRVFLAPGYEPTSKTAFTHNFRDQSNGFEPDVFMQPRRAPSETFEERTPELEASRSAWPASEIGTNAPQNMSVQEAETAASSGRKEVFDVAALSVLLKAMNERALGVDIIPVLEEAVSQIGEQLIRFYWHADDFQERYGKATMPELEDMLLNTFESLDELALFLKKKNVGADRRFDAADSQDSANN